MKIMLFCVFDRKAQQMLGTPFCERTDETAARAYSDMAANEKSLIGMHPSDFDLYRLAEVDLVTRHVDVCEETLVLSGEQWLRIKAQEAE